MFQWCTDFRERHTELHVLVDSEGGGVAASHRTRAVMGLRCCPWTKRRVNRRQIFGIALLIVVDLIWVGSAGLTKV